jgi:ABC-2 type transport system ATP-binding protein
MLVEEKTELMRKLGKKQLTLQLHTPLAAVPVALARYALELHAGGLELTYTYDTKSERTGISGLLAALGEAGIRFKDLQTTQSSLEEIFVSLVKKPS